MDLSRYEEIFRQESVRYLSELEALLREAEKDPAASKVWGDIHGKVHSIKGMARALSLDRISAMCHQLESWCKAFQGGEAAADAGVIDFIGEGIEVLRLLVARKGELDSAEIQHRFSQAAARLEAGPESDSASEGGRAGAEQARAVRVKPIDEVRVRYSLIEELIGLGQEIQMLEKTLPPMPDDDTLLGVRNWIDEAMALMKTFFFRLSHLRLMPIEDFMALFTHALHQLAKASQKKVRLEVAGGEIQADAALLERLREPLIHLLRNCIAHGIESPEERAAAGKPEAGTIRVAAEAHKERLHLQISDDGRGIDTAQIRSFLREKRNVPEDEIDAMGEEALLRTILEPDYSSMQQTTDIAGRGVGMSVVGQAIEHLGGALAIHSKVGAGTGFEIRMPLSLSIIHAVTFRSGPFAFSVPTSEVASIRRAAGEAEEEGEGAVNLMRYVSSNAAAAPCFHVIELKDGSGQREGAGRVLRGILADDIVGNRPLMVMPIGEPLSSTGLYSGVGIMENGDISMVLDTVQLSALPLLTNVDDSGADPA